MKVRELIKLVEKAGWVFEREGKGSHTIYIHPNKPNPLSIPVHSGDIPKGTLNSILKQAGIKK